MDHPKPNEGWAGLGQLAEDGREGRRGRFHERLMGLHGQGGPKAPPRDDGSCFGARAIVVVVAQDLKAVVAGDLHTTPAWDEMEEQTKRPGTHSVHL